MTKVRFTVDVDGRPRSLFSAIDRKGVTLGLPTSTMMAREAASNPPLDPRLGARVIKHYYSIHQSKESIEGINAINNHKIIEGKKIESCHYTKAIKNGNAFAPLFYRRCIDLSPDCYVEHRTGGKKVSIGSYEPSTFTLLFNVLASAPGLNLEIPSNLPFKSVKFDFSEVRITVVYTYLTIPSNITDFTIHIYTLNSTEEAEKRLMDGISASQCIDYFKEAIDKLSSEYFAVLERNLGQEEMEFIRRRANYMRNGRKSSPDWLLLKSSLGTRILQGYLWSWPLR